MKTKILLFATFLMYSTSSFGQWQKINTVSNHLIWNIQFADNNTIYAVGDSLLMKSSDAGYNWIDLMPNIASLNSGNVFFNLSFVSKDTGYVVCGNTNPKIMKTNDGGLTWNQLSNLHLPLGALDISTPTENVAYLTGGFCDSCLSKSIDKGITWTHISRPTLTDAPMSIHFLTDKIGFTGDDEIYRTTDGGNSWNIANTVSGWMGNDRITDYKFLDNQIGFALTDNWNIYKTIDAGQNWTINNLPISNTSGCRGIEFDQKNYGYITGYGLDQPFISNNGGQTWVIDASYPTSSPSMCVSISKNHKVIIGAQDGKVLIRQNIPLSINPNSITELINLYPNPTKDKINIETENNIENIMISDVTGKIVFTIFLNNLTRNYQVDLTNYAKGIYLLNIKTNKKIITKKVVLN
jgi:photosystem II stability/assembly factor-like uncharacterized protein